MSTWTDMGAAGDIEQEDVVGVEIGGRAYAIYRSLDDVYYATDGLCTHQQVRLCEGLVMGHIIECPKHNGRFDYTTGEGRGVPIRENLRTYPAKVVDGRVLVDLG
jgi:3-phenylpropionate/trans-cinnamate dioxygenase ferredoxin subunit